MVGPRACALLVLLTLSALPASGSLLEDLSGERVSYQFDGETHHDAPDACEESDPLWSFAAGQSTDGMLLPPDDNSDVFRMDVAPDQVGQRIVVSLIEANSVDLALSILAPMCDGDVFATQNQPLPPPAPPAPAAGERQVSLPRGAEPWHCSDGDEWYFGLTGLAGTTPPATIYVAWTDGTSGPLDLVWQSRKAAAYGPATSLVMLEGAWANLPSDSEGELALGLGPCGAPDGGAVYGEPARLGDDWIAFTPVRAGPHEVVVALAPVEPTVPRSIPVSCHWCAPEAEEVSQVVDYSVGSRSTSKQD